MLPELKLYLECLNLTLITVLNSELPAFEHGKLWCTTHYADSKVSDSRPLGCLFGKCCLFIWVDADQTFATSDV